jgi:uncharacterized protein with HEPN domain
MPSKHAAVALFDIRDNARLAQEFGAGMSLETFKADRRTFYALTRCLKIVSEAARRLPGSVRDRHPELPWRAIMDVAKCTAMTTTTWRKNLCGARCNRAYRRS